MKLMNDEINALNDEWLNEMTEWDVWIRWMRADEWMRWLNKMIE